MTKDASRAHPVLGRVAGPRQRQPLHPRAEHHQQGRQEHQSGDGGDGHDRDAGVGERAQEEEREDEHRRQGHRDGGGAEDDGAPGGAQGGGDRLSGGGAASQLLAVAADDQQGVVHAEADAERRGQVQGEDADVGDADQRAEGGEGADDGHAADQQREQAGDHAAEDQQQQHKGQRDGQGLGAGQVLRDAAVHVDVALLGATGRDVGGAEVAGEPGPQQLRRLVGLVLTAGDMGDDQGTRRVPAAQGRAAAR